MAPHLRSAERGGGANVVSARHASATAGQTRLIRLGKAANDNHAAGRSWRLWISATVLIVAVIVLVWSA